ncbi:sigma-70 family RNA polymerase sigma factor [Streptomyces sp. NPDC000878]
MSHAPSSGSSPTAERYRARLLRYVYRLTSPDRHRAEDIVQETMLRAWLTAADLDRHDEDRRIAWLYRVARNLAIDAHRRDRAVPVGVIPDGMLHRPDSSGDLADGVADRQVVRLALAGLSPEHREVLVHIHLRDRTRAETARTIGVPQGTVKSRNHYALLALRHQIQAA